MFTYTQLKNSDREYFDPPIYGICGPDGFEPGVEVEVQTRSGKTRKEEIASRRYYFTDKESGDEMAVYNTVASAKREGGSNEGRTATPRGTPSGLVGQRVDAIYDALQKVGDALGKGDVKSAAAHLQALTL